MFCGQKEESKEEKVYVVEEIEEELALMMAILVEYREIFLQGASDSYDDCLWFLDIGSSSHVTGKKLFFHKIDENQKGKVRFGDRSTILYEGKGDILVTFKNDEEMVILNVLYFLDIKINILSLCKLDDQCFKPF